MPKNNPSLRIQLSASDDAQLTYTNGDKVTGQIHLLPSSGLSIDRISLHFIAEIVTQVTTGAGENRRTHHGRALLFHFCRDLPLTSVPVLEGTAWPFTFEFPWKCLPAPMKKPFPPHELFHHEPGYSLPPTFATLDDRQKVIYYLEVVAHDRNAIFFGTVKNRLELAFMPSRPQPDPSPNLLHLNSSRTCKSRKLDPVLAAQKLSIGQKTKRWFSSSEVKPTATFTVHSSVPGQTCAGSTLPMTIGMEYNHAKSTAPEVPTIYLCNIHARLTAITDCRVPYKSLFAGTGNYGRLYREKILLVNRSFSMPMNEHMQLDELIGGLRTQPNLPPSFKSYNISRHYILKVTAVVACAQQNFDIWMGSGVGAPEFVVMSGVFKPVVTDEPQRDLDLDLAAVRLLGIEDDEEELPPYEEQDSGRTPVPGYSTHVATH
ncbi:hypothetical protein MMC11_001968 [Xylographa trunciseda]|nr:hypothetical protein [Xylographa trunciseda]